MYSIVPLMSTVKNGAKKKVKPTVISQSLMGKSTRSLTVAARKKGLPSIWATRPHGRGSYQQRLRDSIYVGISENTLSGHCYCEALFMTEAIWYSKTRLPLWNRISTSGSGVMVSRCSRSLRGWSELWKSRAGWARFPLRLGPSGRPDRHPSRGPRSRSGLPPGSKRCRFRV